MMKKIFSTLALLSSLAFASASNAQTVFPSGGVDLSGNAGSPVIGVYNQTPTPVIAIVCVGRMGPIRMNFAHPIMPGGLAQVNFGKWYCPSGSTIAAFTADGSQHVFPWVDIHNATLLNVRW